MQVYMTDINIFNSTIQKNNEIWHKKPVLRLAYHDFYDQKTVHVFEQEATDSLHGRLSCVVTTDGVLNLPESWPRGSNKQINYYD